MKIQELTPPHEPRNMDKLDAMIETLRTGGTLSRVVADCHYNAYTGSHRIAAYIEAYDRWNSLCDGWDDEPIELDVEFIDEATYDKAMDYLGIDTSDEWSWLGQGGDFNDVVKAIFECTDDEDIKAALADQIY